MAEKNIIEFLFQGSDEASPVFEKLQSGFGAVEGALKSLGIAFGAFELAKFVNDQIETVDMFGKMAEKTGVTTEKLSQLQGAFVLADLGTEGLSNSFRFLNRQIAHAEAGNKLAQASFKALGISMADIKGKSPDEVLLKVSDAFASAKDGAAKTALAMQIFGREGSQMIPVLNMGSKSIEDMMHKSDALGLTIDKKFSEQARRFEDSLKMMHERSQGTGRGIAKALLPVLNETFDAFSTLFSTGESSTAWATALGYTGAVVSTALLSIVAVIKELYMTAEGIFQALGTLIGGFAASVMQLAEGNFKAAGQTMVSAFSDAATAINKSKAAVESTAAATDASIVKIWKSVDTLKTKTGELGSAAEEANKHTLHVIDPLAEANLKKILDKQRQFVAEVGKLNATAAGNHIALAEQEYQKQVAILNSLHFSHAKQVEVEAQLDKWLSTEKLRVKNEEVLKLKIADSGYEAAKAADIQRNAANLRAAGLTELQIDEYVKGELAQQQLDFIKRKDAAWGNEYATAAEQAQQKADEEQATLELNLRQGLITREQYNKASYQAEVTHQAALGNLTAQVEKNRLAVSKMTDDQKLTYTSNALTKISELMQTHNRTQFAIGKAAAIAQAVINTYQAATAAFASASAIPFVGWILGPIAAAAAIALGIQNVNHIRAQHMSGQAHAGMTDVPSEGTYLLNKGERVLSPAQNTDLKEFMGGGGGGGTSIGNLTIHILENVSNADALLKMSAHDMKELVSSKIIPALNDLDRRGIRPNAVQKYAR